MGFSWIILGFLGILRCNMGVVQKKCHQWRNPLKKPISERFFGKKWEYMGLTGIFMGFLGILWYNMGVVPQKCNKWRNFLEKLISEKFFGIIWDLVGLLWDFLGYCCLTWVLYHRDVISGEIFGKTSFRKVFLGIYGIKLDYYGISWDIVL